MQRYTTSRRRRQPARRLAGPIGFAAAGAATAAGVMFGRKAVTAARTGRGIRSGTACSIWPPASSSRNTRWTR